MPVTTRIHAVVQMRHLYTCAVCGVVANGDTRREEFDVANAISLAHCIAHVPLTSAHMPVGWSFDGTFKCEKCTKGEGK